MIKKLLGSLILCGALASCGPYQVNPCALVPNAPGCAASPTPAPPPTTQPPTPEPTAPPATPVPTAPPPTPVPTQPPSSPAPCVTEIKPAACPECAQHVAEALAKGDLVRRDGFLVNPGCEPGPCKGGTPKIKVKDPKTGAERRECPAGKEIPNGTRCEWYDDACGFHGSEALPTPNALKGPERMGVICSGAATTVTTCPSPGPSLPPPPTPTPAPGGESTADYVRIFLFGGQAKRDNQSGLAPCPHGQFCNLIIGHDAIFTATPKDDPPCVNANCDAEKHTLNLTWGIGSNCDTAPNGCVWFKESADAGPFKATVVGANGFNLEVMCQTPGGARLWARLDEPQGTLHHSRDIGCK